MDAEAAAILRQEATAYDVLGVDPRADANAIRRAYHNRSMRWHPDRCNHARRTEVMQRINSSYESVRDEARRANYDESLRAAARRARRNRDSPWIGATMRNGAYGRLMEFVAKVDRDGVFEMTLPTIVVVGLESHGKSSLMERLALRDVFPRGVGFVTRMPILLKLRQVNFENSVGIRLIRLSGSSVVEEVEEEKKFYDIGQRNFAEVVAEKMQQFISQRGGGSGNMQVVIDHRIEIEIRAADLVDIDLLDLPGIVSMPKDVAEASLRLTRDFLQRDDTLALCVIDDLLPAVRSSQALGEIGRVDGLGARTIVVLTKVDMLQGPSSQQTPARLAHRLANPATTVGFAPKAFIPVINRGEDDGRSLSDTLDAEEATFAEWKRTTPELPAADHLGLTGVLTSLNSLIEEHIRQKWLPHQLEKATRRLKVVRDEIDSLGALPVSSELFLDRLCEVVSEKLAELDLKNCRFNPEMKFYCDWMAKLNFPADVQGGGGRFNRVRRRMRAKAIWKLIVESVPSEDLVRKLISAALSDSQLPVKMDRFDQSIGHTLHGYAMNDNGAIETLTNLGFPEYLYESSGCVPSVYVNNNEAPNKRQMEAADLRIREEAKDAILEHVFMPLAERSFWSGLQLDLQESPQSRDRRNHLLAQDAALVRLIDELNRFRDGQHSNAQYETDQKEAEARWGSADAHVPEDQRTPAPGFSFGAAPPAPAPSFSFGAAPPAPPPAAPFSFGSR